MFILSGCTPRGKLDRGLLDSSSIYTASHQTLVFRFKPSKTILTLVCALPDTSFLPITTHRHDICPASGPLRRIDQLQGPLKTPSMHRYIYGSAQTSLSSSPWGAGKHSPSSGITVKEVHKLSFWIPSPLSLSIYEYIHITGRRLGTNVLPSPPFRPSRHSKFSRDLDRITIVRPTRGGKIPYLFLRHGFPRLLFTLKTCLEWLRFLTLEAFEAIGSAENWKEDELGVPILSCRLTLTSQLDAGPIRCCSICSLLLGEFGSTRLSPVQGCHNQTHGEQDVRRIVYLYITAHAYTYVHKAIIRNQAERLSPSYCTICTEQPDCDAVYMGPCGPLASQRESPAFSQR
jgi:hypothetical protein